jgi:hypothetical protein
VEAIGRVYCPIAPGAPGCRQGMILAQVAAWQLLPCSGAFCLGTFWFDDATSGSLRRITVAA